MTSGLLLSDFEQQYSVQTAEITARIGELSQTEAGQRVKAIGDIQRALAEVDELLEQMEMAVRELTPASAERSKYELRVRSYRQDKKQLDGELQRAVQRLRENDDRGLLLGSSAGGSAADDGRVSIAMEEQLIGSTDRLERSSRKLQDAYRMAVETEQIGTEMLDELATQRESIGRARDRMRAADADLARSSKLLSQMIRRVLQNRLLLLVIFVFLLILLLIGLYHAL